jgi:PAS domain S-box-containing protein
MSEPTWTAFLEDPHDRTFRDLAERSGAGIYLLQDGLFHYVNARFAEIHGYEVGEMLYRLGPRETVFAEDITEVEENIQKRISGKVRYLHSEFRIVTKSGEVRRVEVYSSRTTYRGKPAVIGTLLDITERKRSEEEIRRLNHELQRHIAELDAANEELKAFSYSVSHDLKTPLMGVEYASRKLFENYRDRFDEKGQQYLRMILDGSIRMEELIRDLLAFFSLGREEIEVAPVDMGDMVREVFGRLGALEPDRPVELRLNPIPDTRGDKAMIRRIWENLLCNAFKYSRPRKMAVIEVGCASNAEGDTYYVKDNGIGFSMNEAGRLFKVFARLHPADEFKGTGLGLAIVKRIVERHGGSVWAEAKVDEGATFYFSFPASRKNQRERTARHKKVAAPKACQAPSLSDYDKK